MIISSIESGGNDRFLLYLRHAVVPNKLLVPVPEIEDLSVGTCSGQCIIYIMPRRFKPSGRPVLSAQIICERSRYSLVRRVGPSSGGHAVPVGVSV